MSRLDHRLLRTSHPRHAGPYLHKIATEGQISTNSISQELLDAVTKQSLPPRVYELWLCACPDETAIVLGLQQDKSVQVRRGAIKAFRRWFRTSKCADIWHAVGGTKGIVESLAKFSVNHVREFCKVLGQCGTSTVMREERQVLVTELMYCLASPFFLESAKVQNPDERPLWEFYAELVYACTPEARDVWTLEKHLPEVDMFRVMQTNTDYHQQQCLKKAIAGEKDLQKYSALFVSLPESMSGVDPTVPQSMEFAALFLETLVEHDIKLAESGGDGRLGAAFVTIIRRLARRNISKAFALETVNLISRCAKQHVVKEASMLSADYTEYVTDIARLWVRDPDAFEAPLSALLKVGDRINLLGLTKVISAVTEKMRYRLLRWLVLTQHNFDIDTSADQLHGFGYGVGWSLLVALPKSEARDLVDRISKVKGEHGGWLNTVDRIPDLAPVNIDVDLLRCHLIDDDGIRLDEAEQKTAKYQRSAEKERDSEKRINWAIAAGHMAVLSGSLEVLHKFFVWARRFNRDPFVSQLYGADNLLRNSETLSLLSGIPERPSAASERDLITANVRKGNEIALLLLETAVMCQNEPSFYATHWSVVQHLFADIFQVRLERIRKLRSRLHLSEAETNELIWKPLLDAILQAEKLGIDDRNQSLQFNDVYGPLTIWHDLDIQNPDPSALWFINELAVRRDALWEEHRRSVRPSVMTLQAPWPRGLPVQALLSAQINGKTTAEGLPYVMERAKSVIFMPREDALSGIPENEEDRSAIGCFVDDYRAALRLYTSGCDRQEQRRRSDAAWQYATTKLSGDRLSTQEAILYWKGVFTDAEVPIPESTLDLRPPPLILEAGLHDDKSEWNPDCGTEPTIKDRELAPACLDCVTSPDCSVGYSKGLTIHDAFIVRRSSISRSQVPDFWDAAQFGSGIAFDAKDGFIAAALLLVDALSQTDSKILSEPFPREGKRFSAVFLDSDFVESQRYFDTVPPTLLNDTPPTLLEQLTAALIAKLSTSPNPPPALVKWAFTTLKLLARSDDPSLAIPHIVHVVVNLPDHSSWHRVLLHPGVLKRLSTQQSKTLVSRLAEAVNEKSRQQREAHTAEQPTTTESDGAGKPSSASYVKVTTVKLLAQLMRNAEFIGESSTVEILVRMFTEATHIDIRAEIVQSLLSIAESTNTSSIEKDIMTTLETKVVPFAAEMSESSPMTEQRWVECEEKCAPPAAEVQKAARGTLLDFVERSKWKRDEVKTGELVRRLLLPLIEMTTANGQRWLKIVLRANNAMDLYPVIPRAFSSYDLLKHLLEKYPAHMPAAYYNDFHTLLVFFATASKAYKDLNGYINKMDPSPVGQASYLRLIYNDSPQTRDPNTAEILKTAIFATSEDVASHRLLTPAQLQAHEQQMINIRLAKFDQEPEHWEFLVSSYNPPLRMKESVQLAWYNYCRPIVEYMVGHIDATRTPAWQSNPQRQPARLPDPYPYRLWLLTYPSRPWRADAEQELRRDTFVAELRDLVEQLAGSGRPYHAHFELVVAAAKKCYEKDWAFIAWRLGALQDEQTGRDLTLAELLRVELADRLLQGAKKPVSEEVMAGVKSMLEAWKECLDESVRDRGIVTTALLREKAKGKDKDALPME
ncbi:hypothetical protein MBLNU13_g01302t1 [Cladosporium sp. NU13]